MQTPDGPVVLQTQIATTEAGGRRPGTVDIRFENLGPVDRVLHGVASPSMIYVLLVIGLAALAFELTQPGFGFAGFAGVGMLALGLYGLTVVPVTGSGWPLLVGGIGLMDAGRAGAPARVRSRSSGSSRSSRVGLAWRGGGADRGSRRG